MAAASEACQRQRSDSGTLLWTKFGHSNLRHWKIWADVDACLKTGNGTSRKHGEHRDQLASHVQRIKTQGFFEPFQMDPDAGWQSRHGRNGAGGLAVGGLAVGPLNSLCRKKRRQAIQDFDQRIPFCKDKRQGHRLWEIGDGQGPLPYVKDKHACRV